MYWKTKKGIHSIYNEGGFSLGLVREVDDGWYWECTGFEGASPDIESWWGKAISLEIAKDELEAYVRRFGQE